MYSKLNVKQILKLSEVEVYSRSSVTRDLLYIVAGNGPPLETLLEVSPYQPLSDYH
jgi:hypothetical protein